MQEGHNVVHVLHCLVTGLAYTTTGGEILHIEATRFPGKGALTLTGKLGDVMEESAMAALSQLKIRAQSLAALRAGIKQVITPKRNEKDLHELAPEVLGKIEFGCVNTVDEFLAATLVRKPAQRVVKVDQPSGSPKGHRVPC